MVVQGAEARGWRTNCQVFLRLSAPHIVRLLLCMAHSMHYVFYCICTAIRGSRCTYERVWNLLISSWIRGIYFASASSSLLFQWSSITRCNTPLEYLWDLHLVDCNNKSGSFSIVLVFVLDSLRQIPPWICGWAGFTEPRFRLNNATSGPEFGYWSLRSPTAC